MNELPLLNGLTEQKPRQIAARILQRRNEGGDFTEDLLDSAFAQTHLSAADRGLCQELVYGVVRWQAALDGLIARKTSGRTQKAMLQTLLRLGLYQIFWLDRIPNHAAVNETVEQAKQAGFGPQAGFVNAVLRGYLREFDATKILLADLKVSQPHIGYSHPEWLVARWQKRWGVEKTAQLMEWNNTPPNTFARINTLKFLDAEPVGRGPARPDERVQRAEPVLGAPIKSAGDLLTCWRDEDVEYDFVGRDWFEENLVFELKAHPALAKLASFQGGYFYVQDPSTLLAVHALDPQPGETILDLCAAPGGKLTYMAQRMENKGRLVAHDTLPDRLKLIEENCSRLGVTIAQTVLPSTLDPRPSTFDRILVDAPCSNTGVMRRRVDLRWRIRAEEIDRLRTTQLDLVQQAVTRLKPGGSLVYSTCSLEPEENELVVREFLGANPNFKLETQRELIPFSDGTDGAFVARFVKGV
ncbi:MAG TPA: 16S rRNA (cytosine(967)-C(5))-methyltransferase RsmB [Candidatus Polarisedimenticolia bacterium]|nr:16S rRNA (cytosine(967)-C(5))-methyltransferase RsmB [Candidatus Polarisedimenticolia bacterium]